MQRELGELATQGRIYANKVAIAGDWHSNALWAARAIKTAADNGHTLLLQLGDFGLWPEETPVVKLNKKGFVSHVDWVLSRYFGHYLS